MDGPARNLVRLRGALLWCLATTAAAGIGMISLPTVAASPRLLGSDPVFADLLVAGCAAASTVAAGWLWAITTDVVVRVLTVGGPVAVRRPGPVRLLLLAACGAVALGAPAVPASADDRRPVAPHSLAGLPLPDRATGDGRPSDHADTTPRSVVRVRPGDSLWAIAEEQLGPSATVVDLVDYWHRIYDRNVAVIGPDPDLILPGQLLELPPTG
ncbi:LysM peptidoglycan-binding domain-containing protein [Nocardioides sp. HM23]|uniref:LysM peptidoglycan-binding domain-containing protein n=1 Tax=Nocardioides bizhenqiangii TaxID=3095076 RepID=UPI002ACB0026|nr:LysM peptidoglycan-binding domain-containing protein [Nocardioides sp. HM23]MDZ5623575.1 LysM peptidoglycan-binding domain-containing protein [Nocardioides sp. HM23]